jgi:sugar diacid utilization regulator
LKARLEPAAAGLAVGVGTIQESLEGLPDAYEEASLALRHVAGQGVVSLPDMSAFDYLTLREDDTALRMVDPVVERFVRQDLEKGGALCDTLLAYAAADLNAKEAAETLFVHFNTAHYRLGKIEERTGRDMRRLADVVELVIAIRLCRRAP